MCVWWGGRALHSILYPAIVLFSEDILLKQIEAVFYSWQDDDLVQSFFGVDCLHFSVHGHAAAALALWKNMVWWITTVII